MPGVDHDLHAEVVGVDGDALRPSRDERVEAGVDVEVAAVGSVALRAQLADPAR